MALYDDKNWLFSHIRNSFISSDDTGMCEIVMLGENIRDVKRNLNKFPLENDHNSSSSSGSSIESDDLKCSSDFCGRARTNTAARIEKLEQAKKRATKIKVIKWNASSQSNKKEAEPSHTESMFIKYEVPKTQKIQKSLLSLKLKECINLPKNAYSIYAKFDGNDQVVPTRKYKIILTNLEGEFKNFVLNINCLASAKIYELIGLILHQTRNRFSNIELKPVTHYGLYIMEEDGEIYFDLPPLDAKENVAKFGFNFLALVELKDPLSSVTFDESSKLESDPDATRLKKVAVKQQSDLDLMTNHKKAMEAPFYQSYQVYFVSKLRARIEVHLGISGDKIEIDPITQQASKFAILNRLKPVSCNMDMVAWCEILAESKSGNKTGFRVLYTNSTSAEKKGAQSGSLLQSSMSFKHFDFESDNATAVEIVEKINLILDLRSSQSRKEYLAAKERKKLKK